MLLIDGIIGARPNIMKMAPLARALAPDFSIQPLAFSLSLVVP
jgi:UDP-N-acetylglucosamine 2-epimerase